MVSQVDAIYVPTDNTVASAVQTLVSRPTPRRSRFPAVDTMVKAGGLATLSINQYKLGVETGDDRRHFKRQEPADTPITSRKG